jgi:hypothetical protein
MWLWVVVGILFVLLVALAAQRRRRLSKEATIKLKGFDSRGGTGGVF